MIEGCGVKITELSTHLQGQLVAVNPATILCLMVSLQRN